MIGHQSKIIWDSFRSLLAANAILLGLIGAILRFYTEFEPLVTGLALLGIVLCVAWAIVTARQFAYQSYWFAWARRYEREALGSESHMIQRGRRFARGESVEEGESRSSWVMLLYPVEWLSYLVILSFGLVNAYLLKDRLW
jgi:hypothetical protein